MTCSLPLEGAYNARDLGGYKAAGNKKVKRNIVFRSGDLNKLTIADLSYLTNIPIKTYIDFRDATEKALAPDKKPASVENQFFLPIETGNVVNFKKITPELAPTLLVEGNKSFVRDYQGVYRQFFQILMEQKNLPVLFLCSAGKDRTGFAAAMFLSSLGVDRETIFQDYMKTNECLRDKYAAIIDFMPALEPLMVARREYLQAAFDVIDEEFGGVDRYLEETLQVDQDKMRFIYTG